MGKRRKIVDDSAIEAPEALTPEPEISPLIEEPKLQTVVAPGTIVDVYCYQCQETQPIIRMSIDKHGIQKFLLQCGHTECFEYKVELYGKPAINRFGV